MIATSDKVLKISSETLLTGFAVFLAIVILDRIANTTYIRDSYWTLFAISIAVVAPTLSGLFHFARWASKLQRNQRTSR